MWIYLGGVCPGHRGSHVHTIAGLAKCKSRRWGELEMKARDNGAFMGRGEALLDYKLHHTVWWGFVYTVIYPN